RLHLDHHFLDGRPLLLVEADLGSVSHHQLGREDVGRERVLSRSGSRSRPGSLPGRLGARVRAEGQQEDHGRRPGTLHGNTLLCEGDGAPPGTPSSKSREGGAPKRGTVSRISRPGVFRRKSVGAAHCSIEGFARGAGPRIVTTTSTAAMAEAARSPLSRRPLPRPRPGARPPASNASNEGALSASSCRRAAKARRRSVSSSSCFIIVLPHPA